ncbi:hypothetical protein EJV47_16580 [Hymenobacter gummosus]|uniref:STAS/SEC14 domain-containing protein n=1 Tax=Hymenobacter gummosus TaxID=1776032 RepID=A0A431U0X7_9BACT|nr:hypothetical protein [Hymenobacter gummosus]RTQ48588.1 hypothetical protein EJV47_16580 [Hymenobacter gummosus]
MITLYETAYLRIKYEPRHRLLDLQWLTEQVPPAEFRQGYWQALLLAEQYQTRAWLSDFRTVPVPEPADMRWLADHWYPRYVRLKLDKVAIIKPLNPAGQQALAAVVQLANEAGHTNRPDAQYFDNPDAARAWVRQPLTSGQLPPAG